MSLRNGSLRTETSSQDLPLQRTVDPTQIIVEKFEEHKIVLPERILEKNCAQIEVPRERVQQLTVDGRRSEDGPA